MTKTDNLKMIAALSNARGTSGFEEEVVSVIEPFVSGLGEVWTDSMKNLYVSRNGNADGCPMVQLDAHTDEVGFMVQAVRPDGNLRIVPLGGWVASNVPAGKVLVRNTVGEYIPGITTSKPPHFMTEEEQKSPLDIKSIMVDIGARSAEDAIKNYGIRIGEPIVPDADFFHWKQNDLLVGKAFDCRLGCAAVIRTLTELKDRKLKVNVTGAFAVQEEVGTRGAAVTAQTVKPDVAIVFEGCPADDTCVEPYMVQTALGKGPMLRHMDQGMITHPEFQRYALRLAEELEIPVQEGVRDLGATNGRSIHLTGNGVPTIVIGIPVRYAHTHYGISAYADYEYAVRLAEELIVRLDKDCIRHL